MYDEKMVLSVQDIRELSEIINSAFLSYLMILLNNCLTEIYSTDEADIGEIQNKIFKEIDFMAQKLYKHTKNRNHDVSRAKLIAAKAIVRIIT